MIINKNLTTATLIIIAFAFSFSIRLIWVDTFQDFESFKFNNQFMINTNDGYYSAEGARDILSGISQENDQSPLDKALSIITAIIVEMFPFSFETVILYMPAVFSSLIVIPLILVFKEFGKIEIGFIASLVASITWSYYNRTMVGYYDTDMLNIVFPTFLVWSLILAIKTKEDKYIIFTGFEVVFYRWWYPQSYSLEFSFFGLILLFTIYKMIKKKDFIFELKLLTVMLFSMVYLPSLYRLIIVSILYLGFKKELLVKYIIYIFVIAILVFFFTGGFNPILGQLKNYVFKDEISISKDIITLHFFTVFQTVREAGQIPFETFANRISGHTITFIFSFFGYIWLCFRFPIMLIGLPMLGLGFLAYGLPGLVSGGGLRFTIYAVPIMALGFGFLIYNSSIFIANYFFNEKFKRLSSYVLMAIFTGIALVPNIKHIIDYKVPTVFTKQEVKVLDRLKNIANREDYVISWWDYGYPIRYYSDVKTLVDGGINMGSVSYPVSYILTNTQNISSKLARLDVEYTEKRYEAKNNNTSFAQSNIAQMMIDNSFQNSNDFLEYLKLDIKLPQKTRDIYFYLPERMLNILPTVELFSNLDLMSGQKNRQSFFYQTKSFRDLKDRIELGRGIQLYKNGKLKAGTQVVNINRFIVTNYSRNGSLIKNVNRVDSNSNLNVIFMKNYNKFLIIDNKLFNSLYIQLFVLEEYDSNLFEPVIMDPLSKVYRLKI